MVMPDNSHIDEIPIPSSYFGPTVHILKRPRILQPEKLLNLRNEKVCIRDYPTKISYNSNYTITLGDLHGNPMKLIWILTREGIIDIPEHAFRIMWEAYDAMIFESCNQMIDIPIDQNTIHGLRRFCLILENSIRVNPGYSLRLLGDILADRGMNDYLTLKILQKLHDGGIVFEITFSDHDAFFLTNYKKSITSSTEHKIMEWQNNTDGWLFNNIFSQQNSMVGLFIYIKHDLIKYSEVKEITDKCFIPYLKLISYSLLKDGETIDLFMHAPNNYDEILGLAVLSGAIQPNYRPKSARDLAKVIDKINLWFKQLRADQLEGISSKNTIEIATIKYIPGTLNISSEIEKKIGFTLYNFIWNRLDTYADKKHYGRIDFNRYPDFVGQVIHGHTSSPEDSTFRQINLDTLLGRTLWDKETGEILVNDDQTYPYLAFLSEEHTLE